MEDNVRGAGLQEVKPAAQYVHELDMLMNTLSILGDVQERLHQRLSPVRNEGLSKAEPNSEPTSSTSEAPLVTALKQINHKANQVLKAFQNTYDEVDL